VHTYWRLVRSVRRGRKVVQETVAQLGELDAQGRARARALAQEIVGAGVQRELFEAAPGGQQSLAVRLDRVRLERARSFGAVWLGWTLWRALRPTVQRAAAKRPRSDPLGAVGGGPGDRPADRTLQ
jgi:hypothetical protein